MIQNNIYSRGLQEEEKMFCPLELTTATNTLPDWSVMLAQRCSTSAAPPQASQHPAHTPTLSSEAEGRTVVTASSAAAVADRSRYRTSLHWPWCDTIIMRLHCACKGFTLLTGCGGFSTSKCACNSAPNTCTTSAGTTAQPCDCSALL